MSREELSLELRRRMSRPQRHRLLQGYPMAPVLEEVEPAHDPLHEFEVDPSRSLIIGVLPHTYCNPKVKGCGFCTFPHEKLANTPMRRTVEQVAIEIERTVRRHPSLRARTIDAVYFGGGTANLTPPDGFERLLEALGTSFDLRGAELTLEGVPRYFLLHDEALLDLLAGAGVRHRRLSMGVQTFDPGWLKRMGRDAFGDEGDIRRVIEAAHRRGFTISADLLFNLPGTSVQHALEDVRKAVALGLDQVCVYNLVLTQKLPTVWARNVGLLDAMPTGDQAVGTWLAVRDLLLAQGYVQTTLTNFERAEVASTPRRFVYELASFDPERRDALGFGPGAISTFTCGNPKLLLRALKWMNQPTSEGYSRAMTEYQRAVATTFGYLPLDLSLLHLTRNLARLRIDGAAYERVFGSSPFEDFAASFELFEEAHLLRREGQVAHLTPEGMFYADSIAGLLAHPMLALRRQWDKEGEGSHMG
jgi:oxygen-independent coproporphyrinogen-3 oxidase